MTGSRSTTPRPIAASTSSSPRTGQERLPQTMLTATAASITGYGGDFHPRADAAVLVPVPQERTEQR